MFALILSLSNGVQEYIDKTERETLSSYPLIIEKSTMNIESLISNAESYKRLLKDRLGDKYGEIRKSLLWRTIRDDESWKWVPDRHFSNSWKRRPRRPVKNDRSWNIIKF